MSMDNPVIAAPEGEVISGVAMDIDDDAVKEGKEEEKGGDDKETAGALE